MQHTPGPWTVTLSNDARKESRIVGADETTVVAGRFPLSTDARLMAAAPDLLAALRDLIEDLGEPEDGIQANLMEAGRAAINKATGE